MPIKKDDTGKRWVEMEFVAQGTPEQIWQAMATGNGNSAWFTKATIEERVGGKLRFYFGSEVNTTGEVTVWDPPRRFGYVETEWNGNAPPVATEITIASRSGGQCVVRMVHSLFSSTDEWDDQMEGFEGGWPGFFEVLKIYLANFAGMKGHAFIAMTTVESDHLAAWTRYMGELDLAGANVGEHKQTSVRPESLSGVVERVYQDKKQRWVLMRLEQPSPGVALLGTYDSGKGVNLSATVFFYGDGAAQKLEASEQRWRGWFAEAYPSGVQKQTC